MTIISEEDVEKAIDAYLTWSKWREWDDKDVAEAMSNMRAALEAVLLSREAKDAEGMGRDKNV